MGSLLGDLSRATNSPGGKISKFMEFSATSDGHTVIAVPVLTFGETRRNRLTNPYPAPFLWSLASFLKEGSLKEDFAAAVQVAQPVQKTYGQFTDNALKTPALLAEGVSR
jgi:hypothetical protein